MNTIHKHADRVMPLVRKRAKQIVSKFKLTGNISLLIHQPDDGPIERLAKDYADALVSSNSISNKLLATLNVGDELMSKLREKAAKRFAFRNARF